MNSSLELKAIYNSFDTRMNMYEFDDIPKDQVDGLYPDLQKIKTNALAVACLMIDTAIIENTNGYSLHCNTYTLSKSIYHKKSNQHDNEVFNCPLHKREKFHDDLVPGFGSAFLAKIGKKNNKIITAGHCVGDQDSGQLYPKEELDKIRVVFRFHKTHPNLEKRDFETRDVYKIKKIIKFSVGNISDPDFAIIKLDREVEGITPIELGFYPQLGNEVYAIGCPNGTYVKTASVGYAHIKEMDDNFIRLPIDTFSGNSGCPLISRKSNKAVGIVIRGETDYVLSSNSKKKSVIICRINSGYELCQRIKPAIFDQHRIISKNGRLLRKEQSNLNCELFLEKIRETFAKSFYNRKVAFGAMLTVLAIPISVVSIISENNNIDKLYLELEFYKKIRFQSNYKINVLEAKCLNEISDKSLSFKEKCKIARNMAAYSLKEREAIHIQNIEVKQFNRRFSPEKVHILSTYILSHNQNLMYFQSKKFLKIMHDKDPSHSTLNLKMEDRVLFMLRTYIDS